MKTKDEITKVEKTYRYKYGYLVIKVLRRGDNFLGLKTWDIELLEGDPFITRNFEADMGTNLFDMTIENLFDEQ